MRPGLLLPALLAGVTSCRDAAVAIRVGAGDAIIVHSRKPATLPAKLVDARGRAVRAAPVRYAVASGTVLQQADSGRIQCTGTGDGALRVSAGALHTDVVVRCRPIQYIVMDHFVGLVAGGGPAPLDIAAMGTDGRPLDALGIRAAVRDTSVALLRDGEIHPRLPGRTVIDIGLGLCDTWIEVTVHALARSPESIAPHEAYEDTVALGAGEHRFWRLPAGEYHVEVESDSAAGPFALSTFRSTCRENRFAPGHYSCKLEAGGSLVLRPGSTRGAKGRISVLRSGGPPLSPEGSVASREIPRNRTCAESRERMSKHNALHR